MKYPKTMHLPWSENLMNDDRLIESVDGLLKVPVVISEKLDGGNGMFSREGLRARSHNGTPIHPEWERTKVVFGRIQHELPEGYQFFFENTYAVHAIVYETLPSSCHLFNIRNLNDMTWCSWEDVEEWAQLLEIVTVPVLWKGTIETVEELQTITTNLIKQVSVYGPEREGVVVRVARAFDDKDFPLLVGKFVRKGHVQIGNELHGDAKHWSSRPMIKQNIKELPNG